MWHSYSLIEIFFFLLGVFITPWISSVIIYYVSYTLRKFYTPSEQHQELNQNESILFNCWGGIKINHIFYYLLTFFCIFFVEIAIFNHQPKFYFVSVISLLVIFIFCWNSLSRIEITTEGILIYKMIFGTETEVHSFKFQDLYSAHNRIFVGNIFATGFTSQIILKTKKGQEIIFPSPAKEDTALIFGFFEQNNIITQVNY